MFLLLSQVIVIHGAHANFGNCDRWLLSHEASQIQRSIFNSAKVYYDELLPNIGDRLIYNGKPDWVPGVEFYASNEHDWVLGPTFSEQTDVVVGFGTNSSWDIALERKAKNLIIADWNPQVILVQDFLVRPLLVEAKSRAEFLSFISGTPIPKHIDHLPIGEVLTYIKNTRPTQSAQFKAQRIEFIEDILTRLKERPDVNSLQIKYIKSYLNALGEANRNPLEKVVGVGPIRYAKSRENLFADLFHFYERRYGSSLRSSVFSSEDNFKWLQQIYMNGIQYAVADVDDQGFYDVVTRGMIANRLNGLTVSTSNIFACEGYVGARECSTNSINRFNILLSRLGGKAGTLGAIFHHFVMGSRGGHKYFIKPIVVD